MNAARTSRAVLLLALAVCAVGAGGCRSLRLPRIDPTGERILIWPKDQPQTAPAPSLGSVTAPPVATDPFFPAAAAPPTGVAVGPLSSQTNGTPISAVTATAAVDRLTITPERVLAPVGSEVVLKSGICVTDGFLIANQKIDWLLAQDGVGQFVELGGKGWIHPPLLPWNKPKKIDNNYAVGYSANGPLCITRGTADPADDVEIRRGEAWVSVSSPVEGVSHVTSHTPKVDAWQGRRADATIYWVDVQWSFPPSTINGTGRPEQLTTLVTRQTDGMPLEGWLVRYEVNDSGSLAGSGQVSEVQTGPDGRASVEVSPTGSGATSSRIDVELIRPDRYRNSEMPQLSVGRGTTTIHWGANSIPYLPPSDIGGAAVTPTPEWQPPLEQPTAPAPATRPVLEVAAQRGGTGQPQVGDYVEYDVTIRNMGDAPASSVVLEINYPTGLNSSLDTRGQNRIVTSAPGTIPPGGTWQTNEPVPFAVNQPGQHCITIDASSTETSAPRQRDCFTAVEPPPQARGVLKVTKEGPIQATRGQIAEFSITVSNTGDGPLSNVIVQDEYPVGFLAPQEIPEGAQKDGRGVVRWQIPVLEPQQSQVFYVTAECVQSTNKTSPLVRVTAETGLDTVPYADAHDLRIVEPPPGAQAPGGQSTGAASPTAIFVDFRYSGNTGVARVGTTDFINVRVLNRNPPTGDADSQLFVWVDLPAASGQGQPLPINPDLSQAVVPTADRPTLSGNQIRFATVEGLRGGEVLEFQVPVTLNRADVFEITAHVRSENIAQTGRESESATARIEVLSGQ